jgi:hypothetical protein
MSTFCKSFACYVLSFRVFSYPEWGEFGTILCAEILMFSIFTTEITWTREIR